LACRASSAALRADSWLPASLAQDRLLSNSIIQILAQIAFLGTPFSCSHQVCFKRLILVFDLIQRFLYRERLDLGGLKGLPRVS